MRLFRLGPPLRKLFNWPGDAFGKSSPEQMPAHLFHSARLDYSTAILADVSKQNYSVCPRHWYVAAEITCTDCGHPFVFSTSEQKF